jgi:hypothetical protein
LMVEGKVINFSVPFTLLSGNTSRRRPIERHRQHGSQYEERAAALIVEIGQNSRILVGQPICLPRVQVEGAASNGSEQGDDWNEYFPAFPPRRRGDNSRQGPACGNYTGWAKLCSPRHYSGDDMQSFADCHVSRGSVVGSSTRRFSS